MIDFDTLRKRIVENDPFEKCNGTVEFVEEFSDTNISGTLRLTAQSSNAFWRISNADKHQLTHLKNFLKSKRCADAVIWEQTDSGRWILHIIELKRTVDDSRSSRGWEHIKSQFAGAYRLCRMVAAALDVEFEQVLFYTAFVNDQISSRTDSTFDEDPVSEKADPDMPDEMSIPKSEWQSGKCRLESEGWSNNYTDREYRHVKVLMTESTDGTYASTGTVEL